MSEQTLELALGKISHQAVYYARIELYAARRKHGSKQAAKQREEKKHKK